MIKSLENKRTFLKGVRIILAVLMCSLFTGCALLDVKDKGGMENPDVVSRGETAGADESTAGSNMNRFMKKKTGEETETEILADSDELPRERGPGICKTAERSSRCVLCRLYGRFDEHRKTGAGKDPLPISGESPVRSPDRM